MSFWNFSGTTGKKNARGYVAKQVHELLCKRCVFGQQFCSEAIASKSIGMTVQLQDVCGPSKAGTDDLTKMTKMSYEHMSC
jgi:hypothetical protein